MEHIRIRVKDGGQIIDMVPAVATAMILGGTAERVNHPESAMRAPAAEQAISQSRPEPRGAGRRKA